MTIAALVPKPSVTEEARQGAAIIVADLQAMLEADDLAEIVVLVKHPDASWSHHYTASMDRIEMIGRLEVAKHAMSRKYLDTA